MTPTGEAQDISVNDLHWLTYEDCRISASGDVENLANGQLGPILSKAEVKEAFGKPYYHGSPTWGLSDLKSAAQLGSPGVHSGGGGHGIYFTPIQVMADMYAGRGGAVYQVKLRPCRVLRVRGYCGQAPAEKFFRSLALGIDCWLTGHLGDLVMLDPHRVEIVRTLPTGLDDLWSGIREIQQMVATKEGGTP